MIGLRWGEVGDSRIEEAFVEYDLCINFIACPPDSS
jgi:hypothetical protein